MKSKALLSTLTGLTILAVVGCGNANNTTGGTASTTNTTNATNNTANGTSNAASSPQTSNTETFSGEWQIILRAASNPDGETYSTDDWNTLEGKQLTFSKTSATCFGDKVSSLNNIVTNPVYKKILLSDKEFQTKYEIPLNNLPGIQGNSITEVDVTGTNGVGTVFFTTQYNKMLMLYGGGEFFVLEPPNLTPTDGQAVNEPQGAWVGTFENKLFKGYHVIPSRYMSIGNGYWEVWVREVNTGDNPYVTVNQNNGDFHG